MVASVLNSPQAVQMSVFVVRAFVKMRGMLSDTRALAKNLAALEAELKSRLEVHEAARPRDSPEPAIDLPVARRDKYRMNFFQRSLRFGLTVAVLGALSLAAAQAGDVADRVSVIQVPGASKIFKAQSDAAGAIHLLFDGDGGPFYARSQDDGRTFSAAMSIVDAASRKPGLEFSAWDFAVGKDGRVHVAIGNNAWKLKLPQEEWSLHYASLAPNAKAFSPVRNLNRKPSEGFSLAAGDRGAVTACFLSGKLYAMVSRDSGDSFGPSAEIDPAWNPCDCCTTSAAYGPDGKLAVLYREETNNDRDMYVALWNPSRAGKPKRVRISATGWSVNACPMTYFTITPTAAGYLAAWPTKGQIYFARLDNDGAVLPPGEIRTPGKNGMRTGLVAVSATDGMTLIAWKNKDILGWQLYDTKAEPVGKPGSTASPGNGAAGVVLPNGHFVVFP